MRIIKFFLCIFCIIGLSCIFVGCVQKDDNSQTDTDDGISIVDADGLVFYGLNSELAVSNSTEKFSFENIITVSVGATWILTLDAAGSKSILSKETPLALGNNDVYIWVLNNNKTKKYSVNIHRNYIMEVSFYTDGGTPVPVKQYIEEGSYIMEPAEPIKSGYSFKKWNYDFLQPIPCFQSSNRLRIYANWEGVNLFDITSEGMLSITDYGKIQKSLIIPEHVNGINVLGIEDSAFLGNKSIESVVLPNMLKHIGKSAFYNCTNLSVINLPNSLISIGEYAFCNNNKLSEYEFGSNLLTIGSYAFYGTTPSVITIPENIQQVGGNAFGNNLKLLTINYNAINATAPSFLKATTKNLDVTINIGAYVKIVPSNFAFCDFGVNFSYNHRVTLNFLGNNVEEIGERAFYNCKISEISLPESLKTIGKEAFLGSQGVYNQVLTIPKNVSYIGGGAFYYSSYGTINFDSIDAEISDMIFGNGSRCQSDVILNIGQDVQSLPQNLFIFLDFFNNRKVQYFITELNFHEYNAIVEIADIILCNLYYPYYVGDKSLQNITLSRNILSIGESVFRYTKDLKSVYYFGAAEEFQSIIIGENNVYFTSAEKIYNYSVV